MKILYVEDESDLREVVSDFLTEYFDSEIITSSSGNKAIALLNSGMIFDIIISDYLMQDGNGADLLRFMKESNNQTPFIIYTSSMAPEISVKSDNFVGVIEKQQWEKLVLTINQTLNSPLRTLLSGE